MGSAFRPQHRVSPAAEKAARFSAQHCTSWEDMTSLIPNGTQTLSKCPDRYVNGVYPKMLDRAEGSTVMDREGNAYTDYICALGPILLGHRCESVNYFVRQGMAEGQVLLSLPHRHEYTLAAMMKKDVAPWADKFKFYKTGSDALTAAVKVARAHTRREKVLVCGYHGWHDWTQARPSNTKKSGVPFALTSLIAEFKYNDLESLRVQFQKGDIAAVIMEPAIYDEPKDNFLQEVMRLAREHAAVVVFDEVVTGFRFGLPGAAGYFGVEPDLACYSKAMGNGFPIAALAGREEFMRVFERNDFFISGTFGGDLIGINAARGVIEYLRAYPQTIDKIWESGECLRDGFNQIAQGLGIEGVSCIGYPPRTMFLFPTTEHKALFWQECVKLGVLFGYANFITAQHHLATIQNTLGVCDTALRVVKEHWADPKAALEGEPPVELWRGVR